MTDIELASLRFVRLLNIVYKEGVYLSKTDRRLFKQLINEEWVNHLESNQDIAEQLDAFSARFCRLQDTIGDKLLPNLLQCLIEPVSSNIDNLNRLEKLGMLSSVIDWLEARSLRNKMVHEYMDDIEQLVFAINRAHQLVPLLIDTYNRINGYTKNRLCSDLNTWPKTIELIK